MSKLRMIAMPVRDHSIVHRLPRIDVEITLFAVKAAVGEADEV